MINTKKIGYICFFFAILFLPKIGNVDLRSLSLVIILIISFGSEHKIKIDKEFIQIIGVLFFLILLFLINSFLNDNTYVNYFYRYVRCIFSIIAINGFIRMEKPDEKVFVDALCIVLLIHAVSIILSIVLPNIRPIIYLISQYSKKYLPLRSTGLVSGYDFAGYYLNAAIILRVLYNLRFRDKVFDWFVIVYIIGVLFTSRFNTMVLLVEIMIIVLYMIKNKKVNSGMALLIIIPIIMAGSVFTILTIKTFSPLKKMIMARFSWVASIDKIINKTYADNDIGGLLSGRHFDIESNVNRLVGNGIYAAKRDPGIIKTIYEGGFLALFMKLFCYLSIAIHCLKYKKKSVCHLFVIFNILLISILEIKLQFYFASGAFELLVAAYSMCLLIEKQNRNSLMNV